MSTSLINQFIAKFNTNDEGILQIPREELEEILEKVMEISKGKKEKRTSKGKKDPNAPKRPTSAYFYFLGEKRDEIKTQLIEEKVEGKMNTLITKKAGEKWRNLSDVEKKVYNHCDDCIVSIASPHA